MACEIPIVGIAGATMAMCALTLPSAAGAGLVVSSSGPSAAQFPTGKRLDDDAWVRLEAGDRITVLDRQGTRVLRGPGRFSVSKPQRTGGNPALSAFMRSKASPRASIAGVRTGDDGKALSPNIWYVDLREDGRHCLADSGYVRVWRPEVGTNASYTIHSDSVPLATAEFEHDSIIAVWDEVAAPAQPGSGYVLLDSEAGLVRHVSFAMIDVPEGDAEVLAQALIDNGCSGQLELLSDMLSIDR